MKRSDGRRLFGRDPAAYDWARPAYPEGVFDVLRQRCRLQKGTPVLEIGPGSGKATKRLIELGADPLVAVEPDPALADYLGRVTRGQNVTVVIDTFEDAILPPSFFDLVVAATSFHWIDPKSGLKQVLCALRPSGWCAMWWTTHGDESVEDTFHHATQGIVSSVPQPGSWMKEPGRPSYAADVERRVADLLAAGFASIDFQLIRWFEEFDTARIRALYATFGPIAGLPDNEREPLLDQIADVADKQFGGIVVRPMLTRLYTAQRPITE